VGNFTKLPECQSSIDVEGLPYGMCVCVYITHTQTHTHPHPPGQCRKVSGLLATKGLYKLPSDNIINKDVSTEGASSSIWPHRQELQTC